MIRRVLYRLYRKAESLIVPGLRSSQYVYYEVLQHCVPSGCSWVDLGCGSHVFGNWMQREQEEVLAKSHLVVGIDMGVTSLQRHAGISDLVVGNIEQLPVADRSFDVVSANMVVEHLQQPLLVLHEAFRVLRPGGLFVFRTPNILSLSTTVAFLTPRRLKNLLVHFLEGRAEEDVFPTFYRLNTSRAIREAAQAAGFELRKLDLVNTPALTVMLGPVVLLELLWIRLTQMKALASLRPNIVAVLAKPLVISGGAV